MQSKTILNDITSMPLRQKKACRISIVSNITLDPDLTSLLKSVFLESDVITIVENIQYADYLNKVAVIKDSDLVVVLLNFESQYPNWYNDIVSGKFTPDEVYMHIIQECTGLYRELKKNTNCSIVWFGYENEKFRRINICGPVSEIANIIDAVNLEVSAYIDEDDIHVDLRHIIADLGATNAYDINSKYRWNAPYSKIMIKAISNAIYNQYLVLKGHTKKCLVLDCYGVLWGGILSEDGIQQITLGNEGLGRPYQDFQRFLLTLYYHGVILAICSKNNLQDVLQVFRNHSGMILKEEHIACFQVNWDNKPENLRKIANSLSIGLDSMVFVDDSMFEVDAVRALLPDILAIQYNRKRIYESLSCFKLKSRVNLDHITKRNATYRTNSERENLRSESVDYASYLMALDVKVNIHRAVPSEFARIAELTQRTNQCTNGKRYTVAELINRLNDTHYHLYAVYVSDKFCDLGLVGSVGIVASTLDLFTLSCRALGRNVEDKMMQIVFDEKVTDCEFASTGKNEELKKTLALSLIQKIILVDDNKKRYDA